MQILRRSNVSLTKPYFIKFFAKLTEEAIKTKFINNLFPMTTIPIQMTMRPNNK